MGHRGNAPDCDGDGVSNAAADPVNQRAHNQQAQRVRYLERSHNVPILSFVPSEFCLQHGRQQPKHRAIDVIDGGGKENQGANEPPPVTDRPAISAERR